MKRSLLFFISTALLLTVFSSCSDSDSPEHRKKTHTIVAYMMVDGLDTYIKNNIEDMRKATQDIYTDDDFLAFLDYSIGNSYIVKISKGKIDTVKMYDSNLINSDPKVMKEVLTWCYSNYPADDYGLIFGTHGSSWIIRNDTIARSQKNAIGAPRSNDTPINIPTLAEVLSNVPHQQFLLLDLCAGQSVEVAYELRHVADYIIGSPAEIPDLGGPFQVLLPKMIADDPVSIGSAYYDHYLDISLSNPSKLTVPISVIKTSELENLASVTGPYLKTFMNSYPSDLDLSGLVYYFSHNSKPICYDMNNIMLHFLPEASYNDWKTAFDKAVVYRGQSDKWETIFSVDFSSFTVDESTFGGVSMYIPNSSYGSLNTTYKQMEWYYAAY